MYMNWKAAPQVIVKINFRQGFISLRLYFLLIVVLKALSNEYILKFLRISLIF